MLPVHLRGVAGERYLRARASFGNARRANGAFAGSAHLGG
jgi:hypothetical protein